MMLRTLSRPCRVPRSRAFCTRPKLPLTKTIATVGPASEDAPTLQALVDEEMKIMRINFSHATYEEATMRINRLRDCVGRHGKAGLCQRNVRAVLLDTQGPEIRTGKVCESIGKKVHLVQGQTIVLTTDEARRDQCSETQVFVDYAALPAAIARGREVLLDDGLIGLRVDSVSVEDGTVTCTVENSGLLGSTKGVNVPGTPVDLPPLSPKDKRDLEFGVDMEVDFVAASFIRRASDVRAIHRFLEEAGAQRWGDDYRAPLVVSKIENQEGLENFDEILEASDGIMVARGDLGVEIPLEKVFTAQKEIIYKCRTAGKPAIVATQMLESMQKSPRPTRAEVSDVANAVLDGADCVMLSGEVANGDYPVESCSMMKRAVLQADAFLMAQKQQLQHVARDDRPAASEFEIVAKAAVDSAHTFKAPLIICMTKSGLTAKLISSFEPQTPVMCVCADPRVGRQLHLYRSLFPVVIPSLTREDEYTRTEDALTGAKRMGLVSAGDKVIVVVAQKATKQTTTSIIMKIATVK